jgi:1-deoxy-D-xylulose-5-phosphate reductoisomerase
MTQKVKSIALLGSTGSIGTQALKVIENNPSYFSVEVLTANNNSKLLISQALKFKPNTVVIKNKEKYEEVNNALSSLGIKVYCGEESINEIVKSETIDVVLTAMVGYSGLIPTINAIKSGKKIALANKETLVVAVNGLEASVVHLFPIIMSF